MSLETKTKALVALYKKEERLQKQINDVRELIQVDKQALTDTFEKLGLNSSFST